MRKGKDCGYKVFLEFALQIVYVIMFVFLFDTVLWKS
jgi:hypothetical protein